MKFQTEFNKWYEHVLAWEGGYSDHIRDKGGKTNMGVTLKTFMFLAKSLGISPVTFEKFRTMTKEEHKKFILRYWLAAKPNLFNSGRIAAFFAEEFWGAGPGVTKFYQRKLNINYNAQLTLDGAIGKNTISAINNATSEEEMWSMLFLWKKERYYKIVERDSSQKVFERGWANRFNSFDKKFTEIEIIQEVKPIEKEVSKEKIKIDLVLDKFETILIKEFAA